MTKRDPNRAEKQRRCPNEVTSYLGLKRGRILTILNRHGVDSITLPEVKSWHQTDPDDIPGYGKEIFEASRKVNITQQFLQHHTGPSQSTFQKHKLTPEERMELEAQRFSDELEFEDAMGVLQNKLCANPKARLTPDERLLVDEAMWELMKSIGGEKPSELAAAYADDPDGWRFIKALAKRAGFNVMDHSTYPIHDRRCDQQGEDDTCQSRIDKLREEERQSRRYDSGMREIEVMTKDIQKGDAVLCSWNRRIGRVTRVNKISYTIEVLGSYQERGTTNKRRFHPTYVKKVDVNDYPKPSIGDVLPARCLDGHKREVKVVEVRDHFYLVEYVLKSYKETTYCWMDPLCFVVDK